MTATLIFRDKEYAVQPGTTILYALIKLGIDVQIVRPMRDGKLVDLEEILRDGESVQLIPLVSGG